MSYHSGRLLSLPGDLSSGAPSHGPRERLDISQSRHKIRGEGWAQSKSHGYATTVDVLPDEVLLEIFHSCRINEHPHQPKKFTWKWKWDRLAHVCRRWRQITFGSPHRLLIQLHCKPGTPVRKYLSSWPALPIVIEYCQFKGLAPDEEDNVIAALEHSDRVCVLDLEHLTGTQLVKMVTVIQELSFPVLKYLGLKLTFGSNSDVPVLPGEFLSGSALCLQEIDLGGIPFPSLPTLLLSTSNLVTLKLYKIPPTGYISPEAMVLSLSTLTRLRILHIEIHSKNPCPDRIPLPPVTRTPLPALTSFGFTGLGDYLDDVVARIDCPTLKWIKHCFYMSNVLWYAQGKCSVAVAADCPHTPRCARDEYYS